MSLSQQYVIDHSANAMFAACDGTGTLPGTQCRMDGFDQEGMYGGPTNPQYVYVPQSESKPYFEWLTSSCWPIGCFSRISTKASCPISTSSPLRRRRASICRAESGGATAVRAMPSGRFRSAVSTLHPQSACFDYTTLGDELDNGGFTWRFYTSEVNLPGGGGGEWSGYQAVRHIRYGPDWTRT